MSINLGAHAAAPLPRYTSQRAALEAARRGAYNLGYTNAYTFHLGQPGVTHSMAEALAHRDAMAYAETTIRIHRFWANRPAFWVMVAFLVPSLGASFVAYFAYWVLERKQALGVAAPLERMNARTVIR